MRALALIAVFLFLPGCAGSFPVQLEVANATQLQAFEAVERDYQALVSASTAEIERMGLVILDGRVATKWQAGATDGLIALDKAQEIAAWAAGERSAILAAGALQREKLSASPNLALARQMNTALRDWLVKTGTSFREIEALIGQATATKGAR